MSHSTIVSLNKALGQASRPAGSQSENSALYTGQHGHQAGFLFRRLQPGEKHQLARTAPLPSAVRRGGSRTLADDEGFENRQIFISGIYSSEHELVQIPVI